MSSKTTIFAILGAIGVLITQAQHMFDDDSKTVMDMNTVFWAVGTILTTLGIGGLGLFARDNKVSDEQAGAGRTDE